MATIGKTKNIYFYHNFLIFLVNLNKCIYLDVLALQPQCIGMNLEVVLLKYLDIIGKNHGSFANLNVAYITLLIIPDATSLAV